MASFRKNPSKKGTVIWQAVWQEPAPGGKTQRRTKNFDNQKEARAHAQLMEREVERRGIGDPQKHNLERFIKRWLATLEQRGDYSPTTLAAYREHANRVCKLIGHIALERLTPADFDACYGALLRQGGVAKKANPDGSRDPRPLSPRSVLHCHRVMHCAMEQARKWRLLGENPVKDATPPTPGRATPKAFTEGEVARLLEAAGNRENYVVLSVLLVTGIRRSELLGVGAGRG